MRERQGSRPVMSCIPRGFQVLRVFGGLLGFFWGFWCLGFHRCFLLLFSAFSAFLCLFCILLWLPIKKHNFFQLRSSISILILLLRRKKNSEGITGLLYTMVTKSGCSPLTKKQQTKKRFPQSNQFDHCFLLTPVNDVLIL